ncbi:YcaO-like family protein [Sinorhizobium fredii]|uniref:YcaO-like family protein n=1 Tax=Rhizobium fredii TaxID=380 RepID=UPI000595717B|nr:YcaO-like family protein [Sinorhizobium fredii]WOS65337.1 YcaO-like family protein [Sinorhizobium fredii GR64]
MDSEVVVSAGLLDRWPLYDRRNEGHGALEEARRKLLLKSTIKQVPVTRIADITPLDVLGIPVFATVTPLARDLTTHLGKGVDKETARVSAIMESIERVCAEEFGCQSRHATYLELKASGAYAADPLSFDLPPLTRYRPDSGIEWVEGWEFISARPIWVPADLARSPAKEGILDQVDTNGLAAGFTRGRAVRSAILEVVERDAVSQHHFFEQYGQAGDAGPVGRRIDLDSLPPAQRALAERAREANLELILDDLTSDLEIPVIASTLIDPSFCSAAGPMPLIVAGWGADLLAGAAVTHAILEAFQSRLGVIHGARDSYNQVPFSRRASLSAPGVPATVHDFSTIPNVDLPDLESEFEFVLERLTSAGLTQVIVIDLSRKSLGLPVVRVRVPGLSLFTVDPRRVGWRSARHLL